MWRASAPAAANVKALQALRDAHDLTPLAIHANYLINLAGLEPSLRAQSIAAFRGEIERALLIGANYLIFHPGTRKKDSPNQNLEIALHAVAAGLAEAAQGLQGHGRLGLLIENTAGQGGSLGVTIEELAVLRSLAQPCLDFDLGFCLDTCHTLAAGYDVVSAAGWREFRAKVDQELGWDRIPVIHANDSKGARGSRLDRHAHIGEGHLGIEGFRRWLTDPKLRGKAFILETPAEDESDDRRNLETLKSLCRKNSLTQKSSK
jgi:deoxyribonuclease-4